MTVHTTKGNGGRYGFEKNDIRKKIDKMLTSILMITIKSEAEVKDRIEDALSHASGEFEFILISNPNGGVAENRNRALDKAKGEIMCFIDDDLYNYPRKWNTDLIEPLISQPNCLMTGPRLLCMDGSIQRTISKCSNLVDNLVTVPYLPGACFCYKKNILRFNQEYLGWGMEDVEFAIDMRRCQPGGSFLLCNQIQVKHQNEMKRESETGIRNKQLFQSKFGFLIE